MGHNAALRGGEAVPLERRVRQGRMMKLETMKADSKEIFLDAGDMKGGLYANDWHMQ
jgi:hypothetical protein